MAVTKTSIPREGLLPPATGPFYWRAGLWIGAPAVLLALFSFFELSEIGNPPWVSWLAVVVILGAAPVLVYIMVGAALNAGISLTNRGMVYYYSTLRPSRAIRRFVPWSELKIPILLRGGSTLGFDTSGLSISLTFEQARAVLGDPRYPWRETVPERILRRVGLRSAD
jgi:hypothetical protein